MADILVTWFSRSGSTERLARALAQRLGADAEPILASGSYAGATGFVRGVWQSLQRRMPPVRSGADPGPYRLVVVGAPVWAGRPAAPVRSYLRQHGPRIQGLAAFCVSGSGAAYDGVFDDMAELAGRRPIATLSLAQRQVLADEADAAIEGFAARLHEAGAAAA
ncbi:flavodoxin family protein [Brevundimonas sp.]|uniref:flavodoxin family protein n=1 Tax=Brevundimonas sp. TaxID=1871086 RepID=UPI0035696AFE